MKWIRASAAAQPIGRGRHLTLLAATLFTLHAQAETLPSSGTLFDANRSQLSPSERVPVPARQRVQIDAPVTEQNRPAAATSTLKVKASHFTLSGNQALSDTQLQARLKPFLNRELDLDGLRDAAASITALYRENGYLVARAYLPPQNIQAGSVALAVREGVIGRVRAEAAPDVRLSAGMQQRFIDDLVPGTVIREADLERVLLRLSDIAGVSVRAVLAPSAQPGAADIVLKITEMTAWTSRASIDNYGNYYTGSKRISTNVSLNDALGLGESLFLNTQNSLEGLNIRSIGYLQPLGASGVSLGLNHATLDYEIGKELKDAQASGSADIDTVYLTSSLLRSRNSNINLSLAQEWRRFEDRTAATKVRKSANFHSIGLYGDWRDGWLGSNLWSLRYGRGSLNKDTAADAALDRVTARADGSYTKANASFSRLQQLGNGFSLLGSITGQYADKNLDASEKLSLGGPDGVRAYPMGEAAGDEGVLGRLELRKYLGRFVDSQVEAALFADAGRVTVNKHPWDNSENQLSRYGYGVGLNVYHKDLVMNASLAFSPGATPTADPHEARRFWLSISGSPQAFVGLASDIGGKGEDFEEPSTDFTLYGSIGIVPEYVDRHGASPAGVANQSKLATPNGRNMASFWRVRDNVSYIGAHSGIPLAYDWNFLWQLEYGLSLNYADHSDPSVPDDTSSNDELRNTGVALANPDRGTFLYGIWDMPMKESMTGLDPFHGRTSAAHYNIIGSPGFSTSITRNKGPVGTASEANNDDAAFNRRQSGVFAYWTPQWHGLQMKLAYSNNGLKAAPDVNEGYIYGGSLTYENEGFTAIAAYEKHVNYFGVANLGRNARGVGSNTHVTAGTSSDDFSLRYGLAYDFGATKLSLIADDLSYSEDGVVNTSNTSTDLSRYRRRAWMVGLSHNVNKQLQLRATYSKALPGECTMISGNNRECSTDGMGATQYAFGVSYKLNKQTELFSQYVLLQNRSLANYNFAISGVYAATGYSPGAGTTISALGTGINYSF
ncbi:hemin-binding protein [Pseudomonas agarici]|uniref:Hemin-binding protein n=1 Tax=Pseudomonas agarici TaxID=46677 RepID=A0A0X1SYH7_PSEAA|nr:ShlB/FhaC/HecB family hemolysin secretion/activation protein [Pseudomonas agarici]AMB84770.1 hemin-binding protein [Pseudomonas agarici]